MKNNIFNFRRFGKYFVSDIRTCSANFGLSLLVTCLSATLIVYALSIFGKLIISHIWEGPGLTIRLAAFLVMFVVIIINGPSKCYGRISEKKYGSFWLTLPASKLEKFLSMILLSAIIIPIAASALFLGIDAIICALDQSCGQSVAQNLGTIASNVINFNISESIGEQIHRSARLPMAICRRFHRNDSSVPAWSFGIQEKQGSKDYPCMDYHKYGRQYSCNAFHGHMGQESYGDHTDS